MLPRSPAAKPQWPPRSPGEVLASTPSGRARLQRLEASRTSPSPVRPRPVDMQHNDYQDGEEDDDDDEETLQLQLQEIQAKLRLKKLQAAKAQKSTSSSALSAAAPPLPPPHRSARSTTPGAGTGAVFHNPRSPQRSTVEVPASPVHRGPDAERLDILQKSPKRVLLGIDKGLRGQDVSLKRAPSALRRGLTSSASSPNLHGGARAAASLSQRDTAPAKPLSFNERLAAARTEEASRQDKAERIQKLRSSAFGVGKSEMEQFRSTAVDIAEVDEGPTRYSREDVLGAAGRRPAENGSSISGTARQRSNTTPDIRVRYSDENEAPKPSLSQDAAPDAASFEPYSGYHLNRRILPHSVVTRSISGMTCYSIKDLLRDVKAPNFQLPEVETDVVVMAIVAEKSEPRAHKPFEGAKSQKEADRGKYMVLTLVDLEYQIELFLFKTGFERFWKLTVGTVVAILNPGIMPPPPGRHDTGRWSLVINSNDDTILELGMARDLGFCKSIKRDGHQCTTWVNAKRTEFCEFHTNEAVKKMRATRNDVNGAAGFGAVGERGGRGGGRGRGRGARGGGGGGGSSSRGGAYAGSGYDSYSQAQWYVAGSGGGGTSASALIDSEALGGGYADRVERNEGIKRRLAAREKESDIARKLSEIGSGAGRDYMKQRAAAPVADKKGKAKVPSASSASSVAMSSAQSTSALSAATTATTVSSVMDQAAASRASLLASIASRRSTPSGANSCGSTPQLGDMDSLSLHTSLGPAKRKRPQSALASSAAGSASSSASAGTGTGTGSGRSGFGWGSDLRAKLGRMKDGERLAHNQTIQNGFAAQKQKQSVPTASTSSSTPTPSLASVPERSPVRKKTRFLLGDKGIREAGRESLGAAELGDDDDDELVII